MVYEKLNKKSGGDVQFAGMNGLRRLTTELARIELDVRFALEIKCYPGLMILPPVTQH